MVCKDRRLRRGLQHPHHDGQVACGEASGDLESPEKYLAGRENINIFTELLNASN